MKSVTVYCASSDSIDQKYKDTARSLGEAIVHAGFAVVDGGGARGLMGAVNDAVLSAGGAAVGVIPKFMVDKGFCHPTLTRTVVTPDMHERKRTMASLACAAVALPGGVGTLEELLEILTWRKLGLWSGPVVILNCEGYYDPLLDMLARAREECFSAPGEENNYYVAASADEAVNYIVAHIPADADRPLPGADTE